MEIHLPFKKYPKKLKFLITIITIINLLTGISSINFYDLLNIKKDASEKEIKKAFRQLSLKYHPDRNQGNQSAQEMYLKINQAYETLMDPEKRKIYDIYGEEGLNNEQNLQHQNRMPKGPNAKLDIAVDLEELYNGNVKEISITKNATCKKCHGTGGKLGHTKQCPKCRGRGVVIEDVNTGMGFSMRMQNDCNRCGGKGIIFAETCDVCKGRKVVQESKTLRIEIEKGMPDGQNIVFPGESEAHPDHRQGDLILTLKTNKHRFFDYREGNNLHASMELNLKEGLIGFEKSFVHMDKRTIYLRSDEPTPHTHIKVVKNEGMPHHNYPSNKGDLFVTFKLRLPEKLTEKEKALINEMLY